MTFYCGMDLRARDCQVGGIDEDLSCLVQQKVRNDLPALLRLIEPLKGSLRRLPLRHGLLEHSRHDIKQTAHEDIQRWFAHPWGRLPGQHELPRIDLYTQQIGTRASQLLATVQDCPAFHRLPTIPGLGKILAMALVYEMGEVARFQNAREFSSYCRRGPGVARSGPVSRRGRRAQQGSPHLTWAFGQAALYAVRYYPKSRRAFDRHLARPRGQGGKLTAYEIPAHQLAQAVYRVLRDGPVYREGLLFRP